MGNKKRTDKILATSRKPMALRKIVKELLDVAAPLVNRAGRNKAVRLLSAAAVPQLPRLAADSSGVDLAADGLDAAVACEPNKKSPLANENPQGGGAAWSDTRNYYMLL